MKAHDINTIDTSDRKGLASEARRRYHGLLACRTLGRKRERAESV